MKTARSLFIIFCLSAFPCAFTQPPADRPRRSEHEGRRPPPLPLDSYLSKMERENPEEFQRLQRLREEDPQAFRFELREKASEFRRNGGPHQKGRGPHPLQTEIAKVKTATSPEERAEAVAVLQQKIGEEIDKNMAEREAAIEKFREKLKQLEDQNLQEKTRRDEIVENHLKRILGNLENFDTVPPTNE